jgi:hypothetical protein
MEIYLQNLTTVKDDFTVMVPLHVHEKHNVLFSNYRGGLLAKLPQVF